MDLNKKLENVPVLEMLHIVFDGPPGLDGGRFVEVENSSGRSVNASAWYEREDGFWELRILSPAVADGPLPEQTWAMPK